mmetsp:Transcript_71446/g.152684  ORF Transcript_71446/g.152684 Transcript_71446/m.152684 type:complete len:216 (-) Transcript_71446:424-1071(-)
MGIGVVVVVVVDTEVVSVEVVAVEVVAVEVVAVEVLTVMLVVVAVVLVAVVLVAVVAVEVVLVVLLDVAVLLVALVVVTVDVVLLLEAAWPNSAELSSPSPSLSKASKASLASSLASGGRKAFSAPRNSLESMVPLLSESPAVMAPELRSQTCTWQALTKRPCVAGPSTACWMPCTLLRLCAKCCLNALPLRAAMTAPTSPPWLRFHSGVTGRSM